MNSTVSIATAPLATAIATAVEPDTTVRCLLTPSGPAPRPVQGVLAVRTEPDFGYPYVTLTYAFGAQGVAGYRLTPLHAYRLADALDWHVDVAAGTADPDGDRPDGALARDVGDSEVISRVDLHAPYLAQVRLLTSRLSIDGRHLAAVSLSVGPGLVAMTDSTARRLAVALRDCAHTGVDRVL